MGFDFLFLIAAFGGGVLGSTIGGLNHFIITGLLAVVASGLFLATGDKVGGFNAWIAYGPVFVPFTGFLGAAAASAWAASKGKLPSGRDIGTPLVGLNDPMVLLVGGVFGAVGYIISWAVSLVPPIGGMGWTNTTALTVMLHGILVRLLFGKTGALGKVRAGDNRWRYSDVASWLPWQSDPMQLLVVGVGMSLAVSYTMLKVPETAGVWFGVSAFALILLSVGMKAPVWHHIVLSAEFAAAVSGDYWWGVAIGVIGCFGGWFLGQLLLAHGDTHIDPPGAILWITNTLVVVLKASGVFAATGGVVALIIAVVVSAVCYAAAAAMQAKPNAK